MVVFAFSISVHAADFNWALDLSIQSKSDPVRYSSQLQSRFRLDESRIQGVLRMVQDPADAYLILRFAEMSSRSPEYVMEKYREHKHQGWGNLALSLGIKPGSADFKALKSGHDMYDDRDGRDKHDKNDKHSKNNNGNKHK